MNTISLSVIIPVFNGLSFTQKCLANLKDFMTTVYNHKMEIVVVDDGSKDGTSQWIKTNHPDVHVLLGDGNLWWSGGINIGVKYALNTLQSDYILWWNNDVLAQNDYFQKLFQILEINTDFSLIGSKIFVLNKDIIWGMGGKFDPRKGTRFMYGEQQPDSAFYQKPIWVDWFPGMGTTIHRSVFEKAGYLDEKNFPQYHGDSDYTFRAKKAGFNLIAYPQLVIYNDITNTGLKHQGNFTNLYKSLTTIKSNYNIKKDILFFRIHAESFLAYKVVFSKYFKYIGGFFKWQLLPLIGIKK